MAIDRNPVLTIPVKTYSHYTECEPWLLANVGGWNDVWWRDFQNIAMHDCYWFCREQDALMFRLRFA